MGAKEKLEQHMKGRVAELRDLKKSGKKIVGYVPEGYLPEELVYAAGAIPVGLAKGGSSESLAESMKYMPRFSCTWCRSQIGYKMGGDSLYQVPDILVSPVTDCNQKAIGDCWSYWTDTPVFRYGVPHNKHQDAYEYYLDGLQLLRAKLEEFTGNKITDDKIREAAEKQNKIRSLLKSISYMRTSGKPVISSYDYIRLHHNSFYADIDVFIDYLTELHEELKAKTPAPDDKIRLYFTGGTLAMGDYKMYELVDQVEAEFVFEDFAGCVRPYMDNVELDGKDIMTALADTYFMKRIEPAWFRPSCHRVDNIIKNIKDFNCQGVVWYQLLYREGYDMQSFYFDSIIREKAGVPMVKLESDYDSQAEKGPAKTRLESLIEIVQGG